MKKAVLFISFFSIILNTAEKKPTKTRIQKFFIPINEKINKEKKTKENKSEKTEIKVFKIAGPQTGIHTQLFTIDFH